MRIENGGLADRYITLIASDRSSRKNNLSSFTTHLPETLHLKSDKYVIGLLDITFPNTVMNLREGGWIEVTERLKPTAKPNNKSDANAVDPTMEQVHTYKLTGGHYDSPDLIQRGFQKAIKDNFFAIKYSNTAKQMYMEVDTQKVTNVKFDPDLAYFLGFHAPEFKNFTVKPEKTNIYANHRVDYSNQNGILYVYCDNIHSSIVGSMQAPLLQTVPMGDANFGSTTRHVFQPVRYHHLLNEIIDTITIDLRTEQGQPMKFNHGSVILTLHVKEV